MNIAIIISTQHRVGEEDLAGKNIKEHLLKRVSWSEAGTYDHHTIYQYENIKMYTVDNECIHHEDLDKKIKADVFIFATTHTSASGIPSLAVHPIGNFHDAPLGGKPMTLGFSHANLLTALFLKLQTLNTLDFETILEATHHGPFLQKPAIFIEIGNGPEEWPNVKAGSVIAETLLQTLKEKTPNKRVAIGIGGPHHCPHFYKVMKEYAISHVCPKYNLPYLNENTVKQMMEKSYPPAKIALLDWKGLKSEKARIVHLLESLKIPYKKTKEFK